jgi:glycosidase
LCAAFVWSEENKPAGTGEVIYFVMPDRFFDGNPDNNYGDYRPGKTNPEADGEVLKHGFKRDNQGYYHGGDLKGVTGKMGYLKQLGVTAVWVTPIFRNNPVQGDGTIAGSSSAYHGYWITDFLSVDPHLGTNDDFLQLVKTAHGLGIKIYIDIIMNHTADIISYEGITGAAQYRSKAEYPYKDITGKPFNDHDYAYAYSTDGKFPDMNLDSFPYKPVVPTGMENIKNPKWLNNPLYYSNRGNTTSSGGNAFYGDFFGLDDLMTSRPEVVRGMIDIYKYWIREFKVDGFRIDTVRHVNIEFWRQFSPAILQYAEEQGVKNFYMFGEVYDPSQENMSVYTKEGKLPAVLDFGFQSAAASVFAYGGPTDALRDMFANDDYFIDADHDARNLPTFLGNHDMGRIGAMIRAGNRSGTDAGLLARDILAHGLLFTARGVPTVYYGDEQGFTGIESNNVISDKIARQDMFPSKVPSYADPAVNGQIGLDSTPAKDNFTPDHPLYKAIERLSALRRANPALSAGTQIHRFSSDARGGVYAFSRILKGENREYVVALNSNPDAVRSVKVTTFHVGTPFTRIYPAPEKGQGLEIKSNAAGELDISVPAMDMVVYQATKKLPDKSPVPEPVITAPADNFQSGKFPISVDLSFPSFTEVEFYVNEPGTGWRFIGRDGNAPYRVFFDSGRLAAGSVIDIKAVAVGYAGQSKTVTRQGIKIENRMPKVTVHYQNGNGCTGMFAVRSNGLFLFPAALDIGGFTFDWLEGTGAATLLAEKRIGTAYAD